ncbi:MAG: hypothetical protein B6I20_02205 [Bacteroidetes bacterium 4572_117]|nr:MAG: hypothetical protein B6I20_02205 [Bacteroidetes bacterium 4572_117]
MKTQGHKYKIIICDDHLMFRDGLKLLLEQSNIGKVIAEANNGKEFLNIIDNYEPDIVLMDIDMPIVDGIKATEKAIAKKPGLKILVLSMFGDERLYIEMINAGAKGFILKTSGKNELEKAIKTVVEGESYFSNELLRKIISNIGTGNSLKDKKTSENLSLTQREMEVLKYVCSGFSTNEIAEKIALSPKTIDVYRTKLLTKTNSKNAVGLVMFAIKNKLIEI